MLQAAVDKNPNLAQLLDQFTTLRSTIKFWVIDTSSPTFSANLLVLPTGLDKSVVRQPAMVEAALRGSLGSNVTSLSAHKIKIAGVHAIEADADLTITDARPALECLRIDLPGPHQAGSHGPRLHVRDAA